MNRDLNPIEQGKLQGDFVRLYQKPCVPSHTHDSSWSYFRDGYLIGRQTGPEHAQSLVATQQLLFAEVEKLRTAEKIDQTEYTRLHGLVSSILDAPRLQ